MLKARHEVRAEIAERKQSREDLQAREDQLQSILKAFPAGIDVE